MNTKSANISHRSQLSQQEALIQTILQNPDVPALPPRKRKSIDTVLENMESSTPQKPLMEYLSEIDEQPPKTPNLSQQRQ